MAVSIVKRFRDGCLGVGSAGAVVAAVVTIDETSRRYFFDALHGELPSALTSPASQLMKQLSDLVPASNPAVLCIGGAAFVLAFLMFRS